MIRSLEYVRRSRFPLQLAATLGEALGERVREILDPSARFEVFAPVAIDRSQWIALLEAARAYSFEGDAVCGAFVVTDADAGRIAAAAFAERERSEETLSALEARIIDRFIANLSAALNAVFSGLRLVENATVPPCTTYVELRFRAPFEAGIGIGFSREPPPAVDAGARLELRHLGGCPLECSARIGSATFDARRMVALRVGDVVWLPKVAAKATLNVGDQVIATGEGGVVGDRHAFLVREVSSTAL